jgi:hypothetical protein
MMRQYLLDGGYAMWWVSAAMWHVQELCSVPETNEFEARVMALAFGCLV